MKNMLLSDICIEEFYIQTFIFYIVTMYAHRDSFKLLDQLCI